MTTHTDEPEGPVDNNAWYISTPAMVAVDGKRPQSYHCLYVNPKTYTQKKFTSQSPQGKVLSPEDYLEECHRLSTIAIDVHGIPRDYKDNLTLLMTPLMQEHILKQSIEEVEELNKQGKVFSYSPYINLVQQIINHK